MVNRLNILDAHINIYAQMFNAIFLQTYDGMGCTGVGWPSLKNGVLSFGPCVFTVGKEYTIISRPLSQTLVF